MRVSALSALFLLPAAFAQNATGGATYLTSVLAALQAANLTSLVSVFGGIANTTEGMALLGQLSSGNKTVFAPSNKAFANVSASVAMNTTLLTEILSYHILNNTYSGAGIATAPSHTIARTLLKSNGYSLPGNHSAPLVLTRGGSSNSSSTTNSSSSFEIVQAMSSVTTTGPDVAANLMVYIIDEVLTIPPAISTLATTLFPSLAGLLGQTGLLAPLAASTGLTVFAPNNAAISAVMSAVGTLNSTQITDILANHVINGSVVYSTGLGSGNYTSAAGEPFMFVTNTTGSFVMSANATARIIQSDIIIQNGVVHLIDEVLVNTASSPAAAASAFSSGIAAAATSADPTGAITATSQPAAAASGSGSQSGSGASTSSKAAAGKVEPFGFSTSILGGIVGVVSLMMGGGLVLM